VHSGFPQAANIEYTEDSSYLRYNSSSRTVEFPDGTIHYFYDDGPLKEIRDRFGNSLYIEVRDQSNNIVNHARVASGTWILKEKCATCPTPIREHRIFFDGKSRVSRVELAAFNTPVTTSYAPATYQFIYEETQIDRHRKNTYRFKPAEQQASVSLLKQLILPIDTGSYSFDYYRSQVYLPGVEEVPGTVKWAVLPAGGSYEWEYMTYYFPNTDPICEPPCADPKFSLLSNDGVKKKSIFNDPGRSRLTGTYEYKHNFESPTTFDLRGESRTTVTYPNGNESVFYFNISRRAGGDEVTWDYSFPYSPLSNIETLQGPLYLSEEQFEGAAIPANKKRSVYVRYEGDAIGLEPANKRLSAQRTIYNDDSHNFTETNYSNFDGVGHYRETSTRGNFGNLNERTSFQAYLGRVPAPNQVWLLNLYSEQSVTQSGVTSKTQCEFDTQLGVLKRKRIMKAASPAQEDILVQYTYDNSGQPIMEEYFGGDKQKNLPTGPITSLPWLSNPERRILNTYSFGVLATSKYEGMNFFKVDQEIDPNTGLVSLSRDSSLVATSYEYDAAGRIKKIRPGQIPGQTPQEAYVEYTYLPSTAAPGINLSEANAARMEIRQRHPVNSTTLAETMTCFDRVGRVWREKERLPNGIWSVRETLYNAMNWKISVSEWMSEPLPSPGSLNYKRTEYLDFDVQGRAQLVRPPDSNSQNDFFHDTRWDYSGICEIKSRVKTGNTFSGGNVGESYAEKIEHYDPFGRLIGVEENSNPSGARVRTDYTYDVNDKLIRVSSTNHYPTLATNWALASNGATIIASSQINGNFPATAVIDGDRKGMNWGNGGGWNDATEGQYPDSVEITFGNNQPRSINQINLFTLQDNYQMPVEPTPSTTFSLYGIRDFDVQYWVDGSSPRWVTVPQGSVTVNNLVWRSFNFPTVETRKIRIQVNRGAAASPLNYSRIVEVEALGTPCNTPVPSVTQNRVFTYDNRGFLTSERHPELGASGNGQILYNQYDTSGNVGEKIDGDNTITYFYDAANRPVLISEKTGINSSRPLKEFIYYNANQGDNRGLGKVRMATRHNHIVNPFSGANVDVVITETSSYHGAGGRLSALSTSFNGGPTFNQTFTYDVQGNLFNQTYPQCINFECAESVDAKTARSVEYRYSRSLLQSVSGKRTDFAGAATVSYAGDITYHANRMLFEFKHSNNVKDTYGLDSSMIMRISSVSTSGANLNWSSGAYQYDGAGNIIRIGQDWYVYDNANRLVEGTARLGGARQKQKYIYDTAGNIHSVQSFVSATSTTEAPSIYTPCVDIATNRLNGISYDKSGNLKGLLSGPSLFTYDALNMMKSSQGRTYLYGPDDERMSIVNHPTSNPADIVETYTLRGLNNEILREYELRGGNALNNWHWRKDYIYRERQLLASEEAGAQAGAEVRKDYHLDHLGSPRMITNSAAQRISLHQYLPFGEEATSSWQDDGRLRFTGHERETANSGHQLDYMHARYYSMFQGKFLSVDPGRDFDTKNPQSWNLYAYVRNNPISKVDPDGKLGQFYLPYYAAYVAHIYSIPMDAKFAEAVRTAHRFSMTNRDRKLETGFFSFQRTYGEGKTFTFVSKVSSSGTIHKNSAALPPAATDYIHTHPPTSSELPSTRPNFGETASDVKSADESKRRIWVIHQNGLSVYDPVTKTTYRVYEGADWLERYYRDVLPPPDEKKPVRTGDNKN
jgi:RHS repeat-associated protein